MDTHTKQVYYPLHLITVTTLQSYKNANSDSNLRTRGSASALSFKWLGEFSAVQSDRPAAQCENLKAMSML